MEHAMQTRSAYRIILAISVAATFLCSVSTVYAKRQVVKYLNPAPVMSMDDTAELMNIAVYLGNLEFLMKHNSKLKGKYSLKIADNLFTSAEDCLTAVATGAGQITYGGSAHLEQFDNDWQILQAPEMFDDFNHFLRAMDTPEWKKVAQEMEEKQGVTLIKWVGTIGNFFLYTDKGPITSMDDVVGQKIRYNNGKGFAVGLQKFQITGVGMPFTELVSALQTNMVDGALSEVYAESLYDLPRYTKYMVPISWGMLPMAIVVNTEWWNSLPDQERVVFEQALLAPTTHEYFSAREGQHMQAWEANPDLQLVKLSEEEDAKWRKTLIDAREKFTKDSDQALLQAIERTRHL